MDTKEILKSPNSEHAINIFKAVIACIPTIWWPLWSLLNDYLPNYKLDRLKKVIEGLSDKIEEFEWTIDENYIKSEEFWYLFEETMKKILIEYRKEKLEAYKNFLFKSITDLSVKNEKKEYFISIIEKLNYYHLIILKIFYNPEIIIKEYNIDINKIDKIYWGSISNIFNPLIIPFRVEEYIWKNAIKEIEQMWLIKETLSNINTSLSSVDLDSIKQRQSDFWKEFYSFICE